MSAADVGRTISRIAHQIIEKTALDGADAPRVVLLGIPTRGVTLADRLAANIAEFSGAEVAARCTGHHAVPRRPDDEAAAAAGGHLDTGRRHRRRAGDPRRRRAVLRTLGALGAGRTARRGPPAGGAVGGAGRPRPPRTAAARRLRRQECADVAQRERARAAQPSRTVATPWSSPGRTRHDQAPAGRRRPVPRRGHRDPRRRRPVRAGPGRPRGPQAADAAGPDGHHDVLRELHPHPGVVRGRRQVDERRRDQRQRRGIVGRQRRITARHRADAAGRRRRRADHPAPGFGCGAPACATGRPRRTADRR